MFSSTKISWGITRRKMRSGQMERMVVTRSWWRRERVGRELFMWMPKGKER